MILVFGTVCIDRIVRVSKIPQPGEYVEATSQHMFLGGEAANTALALVKLGAQVHLVGNSRGADENGELLRRYLSEVGLHDLSVRQGATTPVCDIYVTPDGERTMIGHGFSALDMDQLPNVNLTNVSWLTAEPNMPTAAASIVAIAKRRNVKTYLMDFFRPEDYASVEGCDVWQSSTDWVGRRGDTETNLRWAEEWTRRFGCMTIVTDGPRPFVACRAGRPPEAFRTFAIDVADTTGAGDAFRAGTLLGLEKGWAPESCLLIGAATAALTCRCLGGSAGHPSFEEVAQFIENPLSAGDEKATFTV